MAGPIAPTKPLLPGQKPPQSGTPGQTTANPNAPQAPGQPPANPNDPNAQANPNAPDPSTKAPGESSFSIKTAQDPTGTFHIFAKNEQEAKQKYEQMGKPLGPATQASKVNEGSIMTYQERVEQFHNESFPTLENAIVNTLQENLLENGVDYYVDNGIKTRIKQTAVDIVETLLQHSNDFIPFYVESNGEYTIKIGTLEEETLVEADISIPDPTKISVKQNAAGTFKVYVGENIADTFDSIKGATKFVQTLVSETRAQFDELDEMFQYTIGVSMVNEGKKKMAKEGNAFDWQSKTDDDKPKVGSKKQTSKGEVEYTATGQIHRSKQNYGGADFDDNEEGKDNNGEPRGRGRPRTRPLPDPDAPKRGRGRPKKVKEAQIQMATLKKQVKETIRKIESLPSGQRNSAKVAEVVQKLHESVSRAVHAARML
jgi:hypothetical protein